MSSPLVRGAAAGCAAACLVFASLAVAADPLPIVPSFERLFAEPQADAVAGGQLLLGELNCTSCHAVEGAAAAELSPKQAPVLTEVSKRAKPDWLRGFIANPSTAKPWTTMPNVMHALPEAEAKKNAEAITQYLVSVGQGVPEQDSPTAGAAQRGERLYHSVGCAVCHGPRQENAAVPAGSLPLGNANKKWTLPGLTRFLGDPLHVRPSGRMPSLNLTSREAEDIASFLLDELKAVSGLHYFYYEGDFDKLPDFAKLTPKESGPADEISVKYAKRGDHFALRFEGVLKIDVAGEYTFYCASDDGSRIWIDDKLVVDNDGVHAPAEKSGKIALEPGQHSIVVAMFEAAGGEEITATFSGPKLKRQPLGDFVRSTKSDQKFDPLDIPLDPNVVAEGRKLFATLGCASCHRVDEGGQRVASQVKGPALAAVRADQGCLAATPPAKAPHFHLNALQRTDLAKAAAHKPSGERSAEARLAHSLATFNCYICHQRGKLGGVEEARNALFKSDMPEMGDEGRLPPTLTGVGAKLRPEWLTHLFTDSSKDRPYMATRMPKFGVANVGHLTQVLTAADPPVAWKEPKIDVPVGQVKAAGRQLVGDKGLSCIKCHTFGPFKATGIQAISLTTMAKRLRHDWFEVYLADPPALRPGTRMPAAWPQGQTFFPKILNGQVDAQIHAVWAFLEDGPKASVPEGLYSSSMELLVHDRAIMYRNFIQDAGSRAIGVGYPERANLAWDANNMRLALLWQGAFIDASKHWKDRGPGYQGPLGENVLKLPAGVPLAVLAAPDAAWPTTPAKESGYQFRGYKLGADDRPAFLYDWHGVRVEDFPNPVPSMRSYPTIARKFTLQGKAPEGTAYYRAAVAGNIAEAADGWYQVDNLKTKIDGPTKPVLRKVGGQTELLVPIDLSKQEFAFTQIYDW